jgi:predicted DNA-binding transcriptional regulator AlpA
MHMTIQHEGAGAVYLPAAKVAERYQVTPMTLWRWLRDPDMRFPRPTYLGRLRFWRIDELAAWEASRPQGLTRDTATAARSQDAAA